MQCHECGRQIQVGDRFCTGCGISLAGVSEPTETIPSVAAEPTVETDAVDERLDDTVDDTVVTSQLPTTEPVGATPTTSVPAGDDAVATSQLPATELVEQVEGDEWGDDDPVWAVTGAVVTVDDPVPTGDLPQTEPITEVWMDPVDAGPVTRQLHETAPATAAMPVTAAPAAAPMPDHHARFTIVTLLGVLGGIVLLVGMFATVLEITSSSTLTIGDDAPAAFRLGTWIADDLADNLSIAGLIASLVMVLGGVAAAFGWRWGSGLAGGGGLAAAGLAALVIGLAQIPIDAAHEFAAIPSDQQFTLTITKSLGYWLLVGAGAIGIVTFFASTNDAFTDRRGGLNPWIAALGGLAVVVATAGPMIPESPAVFSDNWYVIDKPGAVPAMLVAMRLVQLGMFAFGGIVGFLSVRRWGLGCAIGATLPSIWLGVSTLFEVGDRPIGPGYANPGADDLSLHGVTIIGLSAVLAMAVLGAVAAYDQSARSRR